MDPAALRTLEYAKIITRLAGFVATQRGRELAEALQPSSELQTVESNLALTEDAVRVLRQAPSIPLGGIRDLRQILGRARVGGGLSGEELLAVGSTLRAVRLLKGFFADYAEQIGGLEPWVQ